MALNRETKEIKNKRFTNIESPIIEITEDKLRNILKDYFSTAEKCKDWVGALSTFITILVTLLFSNFRDRILPKETWQALFIIALVFSAIYLVVSIQISKNSHVNIDDVINDIKKKKR